MSHTLSHTRTKHTCSSLLVSSYFARSFSFAPTFSNTSHASSRKRSMYTQQTPNPLTQTHAHTHTHTHTHTPTNVHSQGCFFLPHGCFEEYDHLFIEMKQTAKRNMKLETSPAAHCFVEIFEVDCSCATQEG